MVAKPHGMAKSLIKLLFLVLITTSAFAEETLVSTSREFSTYIESQVPEKMPDAMVDELFGNIGAKVLNWKPLNPFNQSRNNFWDRHNINQLLLNRMLGILESLKKTGKLRFLNAEIKAKLGLSQDLYGMYVPLTNHILIDSEQSQAELEKALFHELHHAFQFTYRFPLDLAKMHSLQGTYKSNSDDINRLLNAYYEYETNYQDKRYSYSSDWAKTFQTAYDEDGFWKLRQGLSLGQSEIWIKNYVNSYLSKIDRDENPDLYVPGGGDLAALSLSHLTPAENVGVPKGHIDLEWHQMFVSRLNCTYFDCEIPGLPVMLYREINNNYDEKIGTTKFEANEECKNLIDTVRNSEQAPLITWLSMEPTQMSKCSAYSQPPTIGHLKLYKKILLETSDVRSPFLFGRGRRGGEGGRPGINVLPQLKVSPP